MSFTMHNVLKMYGLDPNKVRLVRHGNREITVLDVFRNDVERLTEYTAWQKAGKYGAAEYLALFAPARGTTSLFLGLWRIHGVTENNHLKPKHLAFLKKHHLPERWFGTSVRYDLELTEIMFDLSERLVVDWGKSTLNWVQSKNKDIVQVKAKNSIGEFISYDQVLLSFEDLNKLARNADSNVTWINALSSVNGVYLIKCRITGKLYVGSAYGNGGILGRWSAYVRTGHGGNKMLKSLDPYHFEFSVLEISPSTMSADDVIARENRWKECLGTREFGLNDN